jgi:hypothetical protein
MDEDDTTLISFTFFYWYRPFHCLDSYESGDDCCLITGRKRARNDVLGSSWKLLFKLRWPDFVDRVESPADWQQLYWEKHLQKYANSIEMIDDLFFIAYVTSF